MPATVVVACTDPARAAEADALAERLELRRVEAPVDANADLALVLTAERLELRMVGDPAPGPVAVDLSAAAAARQRQRGGIRNEALARAAGLGRGRRPDVIDATAGLGRDAFLLASLGCHVRACERHPVIAALLADGLRRAGRDPACRDAVERIRLVAMDARQLLATTVTDVVLVDPMHPPRDKAAAVKKEMRFFQCLVGADEDGAALLATAIAAARQRVVVKRPRRALPLAGIEPVSAIPGRSTRFDIHRGTAADDP